MVFPPPPGQPGQPGQPGPQGPQVPQFPQFPSGTPGMQAPTSPPPQFQPQMSTFAVDPQAIRRCLYRNTFIWLRNGQRFWFYPVFVGRTSVSGFRWTGRFWNYFGVGLHQITSFTCF